MDTYGITGVPGPPTPEKCNDYIAAIAAARPDTFIGYASVNPAYRGRRRRSGNWNGPCGTWA